MPRLSIITPVFNGAAHVIACMDNVRTQECNDVEHLLVDGGSTDGTQALIRERMRDDASVRLLDGPDRGQSHAMNKGIVTAQGTIIGILNVDDEYKPGALALALRMFTDALEPAFLWGACEVQVHHAHRLDSWVQPPGKFSAWRMTLGQSYELHPINPAAYFYHRSLHYLAGLYDESEHYALDLDFLLRAPRFVKQTMVTKEILGTYHLLPGTKTWTDSAQGTSGPRALALYRRSAAELRFSDRLKYEVIRAKLTAARLLGRAGRP